MDFRLWMKTVTFVLFANWLLNFKKGKIIRIAALKKFTVAVMCSTYFIL